MLSLDRGKTHHELAATSSDTAVYLRLQDNNQVAVWAHFLWRIQIIHAAFAAQQAAHTKGTPLVEVDDATIRPSIHVYGLALGVLSCTLPVVNLLYQSVFQA